MLRRTRPYETSVRTNGSHGGLLLWAYPTPVRWFDRLQKMEPWDAVLDFEPEPHRTLQGAELDDALTVAADFIDLKSPYMAGHSRRCAQLAADAATAWASPTAPS